jgi:transposase-like protein
MTKPARDPLYSCHQFPSEVIAHAVWLYIRFALSLRMVEDMLVLVQSRRNAKAAKRLMRKLPKGQALLLAS